MAPASLVPRYGKLMSRMRLPETKGSDFVWGHGRAGGAERDGGRKEEGEGGREWEPGKATCKVPGRRMGRQLAGGRVALLGQHVFGEMARRAYT